MTSTIFGQSGRPSAPGRILIVDSDKQSTMTIEAQFASEGFGVDRCTTSDELFNIDMRGYRLVVVDLEIEENRGLGLIGQVKQACGGVPVIACSRRMTPSTIVAALNAGADDYLLKPFSLHELMARAHAVLRRS